MSGEMLFGPLLEKKATIGAVGSCIVSLLRILATGFLFNENSVKYNASDGLKHLIIAVLSNIKNITTCH